MNDPEEVPSTWKSDLSGWRAALEKIEQPPPTVDRSLPVRERPVRLHEECARALGEVEEFRNRLRRADRLRDRADRLANAAISATLLLAGISIARIAAEPVERLVGSLLRKVTEAFSGSSITVDDAGSMLVLAGVGATILLATVLIVRRLRERILVAYVTVSATRSRAKPEVRPRKRLVVCCDGTWNAPWLGAPTNVKLIAERIMQGIDAKGVMQTVKYMPGVGVYGHLRRCVEGATGYGISRNIRDAYEFLAANYQKDDDIFLFGFSRGAYTVRSLAGLIGEVGLLVPEATYLIPRLYRAYQRRSLQRFHEEYEDVLQDIQDTARMTEGVLPIRFLGVWDTVGALGAPTPLLRWITKRMGWVSFHNTALGKTVHYGYQALALHELR